MITTSNLITPQNYFSFCARGKGKKKRTRTIEETERMFSSIDEALQEPQEPKKKPVSEEKKTPKKKPGQFQSPAVIGKVGEKRLAIIKEIENEKSAAELQTQIRRKGIIISTHGAEHAIDTNIDKTLYDSYIKPLMERREQLLDIIEMNQQKQFDFFLNDKKHIITPKGRKYKNKITVEIPDENVFMVFDKNLKGIITAYKKGTSLAQLEHKKRKEKFEDAAKTLLSVIKKPITDDKIAKLTEGGMKLQEELDPDIGISWLAAVSACHHGLTAEDLVNYTDKQYQKDYRSIIDVQRIGEGKTSIFVNKKNKTLELSINRNISNEEYKLFIVNLIKTVK